MVSVSDILKLLDQIPVWKRLSGLPARLDALEARIAALEGAGAPAAGPACPNCRGPLAAADRPHPNTRFAQLGTRMRKLTCAACGFETEKMVKPSDV